MYSVGKYYTLSWQENHAARCVGGGRGGVVTSSYPLQVAGYRIMDEDLRWEGRRVKRLYIGKFHPLLSSRIIFKYRFEFAGVFKIKANSPVD